MTSNDDELSEFVDEFLSSPAKGESVSLDLGELTDKVRVAIEEAGYPVNHMDDLSYIDADTLGALDDDALGRLVDLVNEEWSSRGHLTPTDEENLHTPVHGEPPEADAITRAYAGSHGAYLGALMASGFNRNEAMAMVMFELNADLARDITNGY